MPVVDQEKVQHYLNRSEITHYLESGIWSSVCPELGVASQGDSYHRARENLREAITLYLETLEEATMHDRPG